jgi:hypothetical protein
MSHAKFPLHPPAVLRFAENEYFSHRQTPTTHDALAFSCRTHVTTAVVPWHPVTVMVSETLLGNVVPLGHEHVPPQQQPACIMLTV